MLFKTDRIEKEFEELAVHNSRLFTLLYTVATFVKLELNKEITITHLFRTEEEQKELYAQTPEESRPKTSPHMVWQAADIRTLDTFSDIEIDRILKFCLSFKNPSGKPAALYHKIAGGAPHFHIHYT